MQELNRILCEATRSIDAGYFLLPIDGGDPVNRERVYCYELYHQMRSLWPNPADTPYCLNGEVDKASHPILMHLGVGRRKPDLLVHGPGDMGRNHAVIEVKPSRAKAEGIRKDLKTLSLFAREVGYQRAIYLFFGEFANDVLVERVRRISASVMDLAQIELWLHPQVGHSASFRLL